VAGVLGSTKSRLGRVTCGLLTHAWRAGRADDAGGAPALLATLAAVDKRVLSETSSLLSRQLASLGAQGTPAAGRCAAAVVLQRAGACLPLAHILVLLPSAGALVAMLEDPHIATAAVFIVYNMATHEDEGLARALVTLKGVKGPPARGVRASTRGPGLLQTLLMSVQGTMLHANGKEKALQVLGHLGLAGALDGALLEKGKLIQQQLSSLFCGSENGVPADGMHEVAPVKAAASDGSQQRVWHLCRCTQHHGEGSAQLPGASEDTSCHTPDPRGSNQCSGAGAKLFWSV